MNEKDTNGKNDYFKEEILTLVLVIIELTFGLYEIFHDNFAAFLSFFAALLTYSYHYIKGFLNRFKEVSIQINKILNKFNQIIEGRIIDSDLKVVREEIYGEAIRLIKGVERRLLIVQLTPSVLFEPKWYSEGSVTPSLAKEEEFKKLLNRIIIENRIEFLYGTSVKSKKFLKDYCNLNDEQKRVFWNNFNNLVEKTKNNFYKFTFFNLDETMAHPLILADDKFGVWLIAPGSSPSDRRFIGFIIKEHIHGIDKLWDNVKIIANSNKIIEIENIRQELDKICRNKYIKII